MGTITIVTPSYNQGQFIEETIISVLSQEGDFFIDYIIADGGSSDNSVEIIKKYDNLLKKHLYPIKCNGINFQWWSKKDKGQSDAINQGFKLAKGEILAWINSDDFYEFGTFDEVIKIFSSDPNLDFVYGDGYIYKDEISNKVIKRSTVGTFDQFLRRYNYIFQPSAFWNKHLLERVGFLDENLNFIMDYELWLRFLKSNDLKKLHTSKVWSNYREWASSKSVAQMDKILKERRIIFKKYGGNIIDPYVIQRIVTSHLLNSIKRANSSTARVIEKVIYFISDFIHY